MEKKLGILNCTNIYTYFALYVKSKYLMATFIFKEHERQRQTFWWMPGHLVWGHYAVGPCQWRHIPEKFHLPSTRSSLCEIVRIKEMWWWTLQDCHRGLQRPRYLFKSNNATNFVIVRSYHRYISFQTNDIHKNIENYEIEDRPDMIRCVKFDF